MEREEDDEEPSDLEVWHLQKLNYTFKDLGIWKKEGILDKKCQKQMREREKGKEKEKEKAKARTRQNEQKEKNRKKSDESGEDSGDGAGSSKKGKKVKNSVGKNKKSVPKSSKFRK